MDIVQAAGPVHLTTTQDLRKIREGDNLVEIVGYVAFVSWYPDISCVEILIKNADNDYFRFCVDGEEAHCTFRKALVNHVIHIDGCRAADLNDFRDNPLGAENLDGNNLGITLHAQSNTLVNILGPRAMAEL